MSQSRACQTAPVTSWRDSVPTAVQDDLDGLFNAAVDTAATFLTKSGEFFPFGFWIRDDEVEMFGADPGLGEHPPSTEVLRALGEAARAEREELQAVALACDVTLADGGDAVRVQLEHREGVALRIHVPYRRRRFSGKLTLGEMAVGEGDAQVWFV
jgi:hypothetical protein